MVRWYVAACKTGQEQRACEHLTRQGYIGYIPTIYQEVNKKGESTLVEVPLFPDYVFIKFDIETQSASTVNNTRGIIKLLTFGRDPVPVADPIIDRLMAIVDRKKELSIPAPGRTAGESVKLKSGIFAGLEAIFMEPDGKARSLILVKVLSKMIELSVENSAIA